MVIAPSLYPFWPAEGFIEMIYFWVVVWGWYVETL